MNSGATSTQPGQFIDGGAPVMFVRDLDRAVRFYTEALGLKLKYRAGPHFAMIDAGRGTEIGLHPPGDKTPPPGAKGSIQVTLNVVKPIEDVVAALAKRGVTFVDHGGSPVVDDGEVKLAFFTDPDGNDLHLCQVMHG